MSKSQFENLGEDIMNSVADAVETGDFSNLSRNVEELVNVTFDKVGNVVKDGIDGIAKATTKTSYERQKQAGEEYIKNFRQQQQKQWKDAVNNSYEYKSDSDASNQARLRRGTYPSGGSTVPQGNQLPALYKKNVPGKYSGPMLTIFGGIGTGLFGAGLIGLGIATAVTGIVALGVTAGIFAGIAAGFGIMTRSGIRINGRNQRFQTYVKCLGSKSYCKIEELATAVGKSTKYVIKDIRKLMSMGYFLQGHLDAHETMLIASNEVYEQYTQAENSRLEREAEAKRIEAEASHPKGKVQKLIREGEKYIAHIHECNAAIPGKEMTEKLQRLEDTMTRIFEHLKNSPESADDLDKMMKYYLPTTTKLIDTYRDLDAKPEIGDNIKNTKREIEGTLDTINDAFEKIFDDMFLNTAWDISSDISVMKTMMAQEGLTQ